MKYLCLVFIDEKELESLSESDSRALDSASLAYDEVLRRGGHFVAAQALQSVQTATTVRMRDGKQFITDGPYAETHEQIGGFILIEAADLTEAMQLASKIPVVRLGGVEIRPIKELVTAGEEPAKETKDGSWRQPR